MPFDAVGFPTDLSSRSGRGRFFVGLWHAFRARLRDTSGRSQPALTAGLLREARDLIADEAHWMQGAYERGGRRCAIGAVQAAGRSYGRNVRRDAAGALLSVANLHGHHSVESMNDSLTHAEVLAAFGAAITRAELGMGRRL
jgi:hypothetical protein